MSVLMEGLTDGSSDPVIRSLCLIVCQTNPRRLGSEIWGVDGYLMGLYLSWMSYM